MTEDWLDPAERRRILVFGGGEGHGFAGAAEVLRQHVEPRLPVTLTYTGDLDLLHPEVLAAYDLLILYCHHSGEELPSETQRQAVESFLAGGGRLMALHTGAVSFPAWTGLKNRLGVVESAPDPDASGADLAVQIRDRSHPITQGSEAFTVRDRLCAGVRLSEEADVLAVAETSEGDPPLLWLPDHSDTRIVCSLLGHDARSFQDPHLSRLLVASLAWLLASD